MNPPVSLRVACIQVRSGPDWQENFKFLIPLLKSAVRKKARLIALPEFFHWRGSAQDYFETASQSVPWVLNFLKEFARKNKIAILAGTVITFSKQTRRTQPKKQNFTNTSFLISEKGKILCRYDKIHLFNVSLPQLRYHESEYIQPGQKVVTAKIFGRRVGFTICYDLRFPELFRLLSRKGCEIIFVPSSFAHRTGKDHWEILLRARAIENQVYIIAPSQGGCFPENGALTHGHSMIIDPWGRILKTTDRNRRTILIADLDFSSQKRIRGELPALRHQRIPIPTALSHPN